ncbi:D-alanyl-D-alanine carboxypeptidase family protein [Halalkalibacterium ligniniphilum]|uniref:D-alanyl-D-alanine carboxypeptidase family protein n=1 Tax=Halalkalibacterium ligniniphilum TaxID=1134413 RepID=UPI000347DFA4|nr:D-alanyl-D-alanine carboxypeptidase [Halalkalibacterium ligniniphilum]
MPGDRLTLEQLLYAMMLPSGNDAAVAIAVHIGGSQQAFVNMMNKRARQLGATHTNFVNPHGYHHSNQVTTANDLALIAKEARKHSTFMKIVSKQIRLFIEFKLVVKQEHRKKQINGSDQTVDLYINRF